MRSTTPIASDGLVWRANQGVSLAAHTCAISCGMTSSKYCILWFSQYRCLVKQSRVAGPFVTGRLSIADYKRQHKRPATKGVATRDYSKKLVSALFKSVQPHR